ncbi:hypothetical protein NCAST_35_00730 [Nocardia asteroides NBRC 15531]|jgi:hypothetical protein|uniref:Uncharacterized protein n=1 Tax=Nocardia asteroides NBRC 15531 TaxID=1110697 RepID=U5EMD3_NOCAS|nr:hypothetical protein NCAST_35_00730 [Nocardia asteroides NBRC 15531]SFM52869.1 hypothetical protein SAMN05444423_103276 [Nocardia asteroides]VEG33382.1 Uncharacterised protein [Nocardia asteroides]
MIGQRPEEVAQRDHAGRPSVPDAHSMRDRQVRSGSAGMLRVSVLDTAHLSL